MNSFNLKIGPRKIRSLQVYDVVNHWDPDLSPFSPRSYVDMEESEKVTLLRERISQLEFQINNERDSAFKQGYEDGTQAVSQDARNLMQRLPREFAAMTADIKDQIDVELKKLRDPLLGFSLAVAGQLIGKQLELPENQQEMLLKNINEFLDKVRTQTKVIVRVNPEQIDWIIKEDSVHAMNGTVKDNIRFIRDPMLKPGECVLETEDFNIEGIVEKQLHSLKDQLLGSGEYD